jgi:hypothetical protein
MQRLKVNTAQLEQGLELGVGDTRNYFAALPQESRLRFGACGLFATAVNQYLQSIDISSRLLIASPQLEIDPLMQHVFTVAELDSGVTVIDPTYSQFLRYFGITLTSRSLLPPSNFPDEKVAVFTLEEKAKKVQSVVDFVSRSSGTDTAKEVERVYDAVWDVRAAVEWSPPNYAVADAEVVNRRLAPGIMRIIDSDK